MKALRAHVVNGQIVLDEPAELPEGVAVEIRVVGDEPERAELELEVEAGAEDFARGAFEDAHTFALRLAAKP